MESILKPNNSERHIRLSLFQFLEQTKMQKDTLAQEMKNLQMELQEHRVNAFEGDSRQVDKREDKMQHDFVITGAWMDILQAGVLWRYETKNWNGLKTKRTAKKKVIFTQDYNKKRRPGHGSEQWNTGQAFQRMNWNYTNNRPVSDSSSVY